MNEASRDSFSKGYAILTPADDPRQQSLDPLMPPWAKTWRADNSTYDYEPAPDEAVFDWDEPTLQAAADHAQYLGPIQLHIGLRPQVVYKYETDVLAKQHLVRTRRVASQLRARGEVKEADSLRDTCLKEARRVAEVQYRCYRRIQVFWHRTNLILLLIPLVSPFLVAWLSGNRLSWWLILFAPIETACYWLVFYPISVYWYSPRASQSSVAGRIARRAARALPRTTLAVTVILLLVLVGERYQQHVNPSPVIHFAAGVALSGTLFLLSLSLRDHVSSLLTYRGQGLRPETVLLMDLLNLITLANQWEKNDQKEQALLHEIEQVARRAERAFPNLVGRKNRRLRAWATYRGRQVAAVLRKHQEYILEVSDAQRRSVATSLLNGLVYLLRREWSSLLIIEPEPIAKSLVRRFTPRIGLCLLLAALAFTLPIILPQVITNPAAFQASVLLTAGFSLIAPDVQKAADAARSFGVGR